ncbi:MULTISPECIES: GGDEF domain-containing protein [Streptomycetaceae]|uniref:GGDEF domain-containing protein n=1 Tax=Streptantibioticus cattleyicolor (strain ATCC 35852 / DSM 46488 / JCM 4925 / NBRC 14057 / NRRL 8057) TaxID=1003195 RepID=F8JYA3_STREN|nr:MULTISPECIES: GGDEF domain-containing protein [Streptomycetaceae]AEW95897.1 hypothetical protein SCATT_35260 [Streptantibioticus cattleyicolor NRRL 8057 = DSM 46488]MYS60435.1 diguanylate cyclase [Streptomyces sp. SID5468]CCB76233.1 conserved protein of unknown function [Streptantibioticus cattleyicolor NRRL 8057 = DSM 46488]
MNVLLAAAPLAAGWSVHGTWMWRRLSAARRDPVTSLPTRDAFTARARRHLRHPHAVVLLVDLDRFKALNDTHGHAAGDAALAAAGHRLADWCTPLDGVVGRLGGDEFAAVVTLPRPGDLPDRLRALHLLLTEPVPFAGRVLPMRASVGAYHCAELTTPDLGIALRRADEAMYRAKQNGGGWCVADVTVPALPTVHGRRAGRRGAERRRDAR